MTKPVPPSLAARRLAPAVAYRYVSFTEALDTLMELALERPIPTHRIGDAENWLMSVLTREIEAVEAKRAARLASKQRRAA